jgi:hypothetical protein
MIQKAYSFCLNLTLIRNKNENVLLQSDIQLDIIFNLP